MQFHSDSAAVRVLLCNNREVILSEYPKRFIIYYNTVNKIFSMQKHNNSVKR